MLPMQSSVNDRNLSEALTAAAKQIVTPQLFPDTVSLVFVGSDAPEIPTDEVEAALRLPAGTALLCPAHDGGYGLLGVSMLLLTSSSESMPSSSTTCNTNIANDDSSSSSSTIIDKKAVMLDGIFRGVLWSHPLTGLSQIKALQISGWWPTVELGRMMRDVDRPEDVSGLCQRLRRRRQKEQQQHWQVQGGSEVTTQPGLSSPVSEEANVSEAEHFGCLLSRSSLSLTPTPSATTSSSVSSCRYTIEALRELGLLQ
jgi:glycosyltransferase A (GT-A) superfamily protein (DUF2064 family)